MRGRVRAEVVLRREVDRHILLFQVQRVVGRVGGGVLQRADCNDHLKVGNVAFWAAQTLFS